ncbi:endolytic transglycosylase MltG [bacterium]|nr:endolytic transglycosylase MltG [bacterium]
MKGKRKGRFYPLVFILGLLILGMFLWGRWALSPRGGDFPKKIFVVSRGEGLWSIARKLEEQGLVKDKFWFLALVYYYRLENKIQAGSFRFSPDMSPKEIAFSLTKGRLDKWITIIEGWRREQIGEKLEKELGIPLEEFLAASKGKEGYLFPDSYLFPLKSTPSLIVAKMEENFQKKAMPVVRLNSQLTPQQIVILASLVEREARDFSDRRLVAGILIKRWRHHWPLQVDATIQYIKANITQGKEGWWPKVTSQDLQLSSPFNTYLYRGLPPAPICNPSLQAIRAVVEAPTDTPYWFYLSDKKGKVHFAVTHEEHLANIKRFLQGGEED